MERKICINEEIDYTIIEIIEIDKINEFLSCDEKMNMDDFNVKEYREASILLPSFMANWTIETDKEEILSIIDYNFLHTCKTDPWFFRRSNYILDNFTIIGIYKGYDKRYYKNI